MERRSMTRDDYAKLPTLQLIQYAHNAEERLVRATALEDWTTDMFAIQEIAVALLERGIDRWA